MTRKILYKSSVGRDIKHIDLKSRERLLAQIKSALGDSPNGGERLHGEFEGLLKLRIGEYRVVYTLVGEDVLILRIRRRSKAYS